MFMRDEPLTIQARSTADHTRILKLNGPLTNATYVDSAGVGALVGAYVRHQKEGHSITLAGVNDRVRGTLKVTQVDRFFEYVDTVTQVARITNSGFER